MAIGFIDNNINKEIIPVKPNDTIVTSKPVKSVVTVEFENGAEYPYYNDEFDLHIGDRVYVEGKLEGKLGIVTAVSTHFKVSLKYYKRVIAKVNKNIHGKFKKFCSTMVSFSSNAVSFEQFKPWIIPPKFEEEEFFVGEGFSLHIEDLPNCDFVTNEAYQGGLDLLNENGLKYFSIRNNECHAIIKGSKSVHQIDFKFEKGHITDLFCDCLHPAFCKHESAALLFLYSLLNKLDLTEFEKTGCLTAIDFNEFISALAQTDTEIDL